MMIRTWPEAIWESEDGVDGKDPLLFINGIKYKVRKEVPADESLNKFIRQRAHLSGTKSMCKEGGCGACVVTVTTTDPVSGERASRAVNSCLYPVHACIGGSVTTIEGLGNRKEGYNVVPAALASFYGTQCGYCSPGMVMNMYSLLLDNPKITREEVENSFGGNICRCTGYRPILDAFAALADDAPPELSSKLRDIEDLLKPCAKNASGICSGSCKEKCGEAKKLAEDSIPHEVTARGGTWFFPSTVEDILRVFQEIGDKSYRLVAGNTAPGVYRTMGLPVGVYVLVTRVKALKEHTLNVHDLEIGGNTSLTDAMKIMEKISQENPEKFGYLKTLMKHIDLVANVPVRNVGTIAGNLMIKHTHREFPSDIFLILETINSKICVVDSAGNETRYVPSDFVNVNMNRAIITKIVLPALSCSRYRLKTFKIMPRSQNVHAYVNAGFLFQIDGDHRVVSRPTIVYGGINMNFVHALNAEAFFEGKSLLDNSVLTEGFKALEDELLPSRNVFKDANYIKNVAIALFYKELKDSQGFVVNVTSLLFVDNQIGFYSSQMRQPVFILGVNPDKVDPKFRSGRDTLERPLSRKNHGLYEKLNWPENKKIPKVEGLIQCTGEAEFTNDLPPYPGELFAALVLARNAVTVIQTIDASPALELRGVVAFFTAEDIPGENSFVQHRYFSVCNEEVFSTGQVLYGGQPVGVIVATEQDLALKAANLVKIVYADKTSPFLSTKSVVEANEQSRIKLAETLEPQSVTMKENWKHRITGETETGEQFHFHMELQTCVCVPMEDGMDVFSSTQWIDNVQIVVSKLLKMNMNSVNVQVRRIGGGFGGKISRSAQVAAACALAAHKLNRPVRMVLSLETNMEAIGKRDPSYCTYEVGFDDSGKIQGLQADFYLDVGRYPNDPSNMLVLEGFKNHYDYSTWKINVFDVISDIPGTAWMRGPGTIQAMMVIETVMDHIACTLGKEPQDVRIANMGNGEVLLSNLMNSLKASAEYETRKDEINAFNEANRWKKRGIAMMSMKFPLCRFFDYHALVSIFGGDGTVSITHGGIEMGQGLNTKVAQACAHALGISVDMIKIKPTSALTSPNNHMSGASVTSETCVYSVLKCAETLAKRLEPIKKKLRTPTWQELVKQAAEDGVDLMATGWYNHQMPENEEYDVYATVVTEMQLDVLTGNYQVARVDLIEDAGESLSPKVDLGQVEGGFVQGLGYFLTEKIVYDPETGVNVANRTWNYWPPGVKDIPIDWRITLSKDAPNASGILRSKSTGEPPICLAFSAVMALRHALDSARTDAGLGREWYEIDHPCLPQTAFLLAGNRVDQFRI